MGYEAQSGQLCPGGALRLPPVTNNSKIGQLSGTSRSPAGAERWGPLPETSAKAASGAELPVPGALGPVTLDTIPKEVSEHQQQAIKHTTKKKPRPNQNWIRAAHPHLGRSHDLQDQINGRTAGWL